MFDVTVAMERDHLYRLVRPTQPVSAVIELVWNALDADADEVRVEFDRNHLEGIDGVTVTDNGTGIAHSVCGTAFSKLGGSWKAAAKISPRKEATDACRLGEGRCRALALGERAEWTTVADDVNGRFSTRISTRADQPEVFNPALTFNPNLF